MNSTIELSARALIEDISKGRNNGGNSQNPNHGNTTENPQSPSNPFDTEFILPIPNGLHSCIYSGKTLLTSGCLYENITGMATFEVTSGRITETTVYINGGAELPNMWNGIASNNIIHINGEAKFAGIGGIKNNTSIGIHGDAVFEQVYNGIMNSTFNINGKATFKDVSSGISNNTIFSIYWGC